MKRTCLVVFLVACGSSNNGTPTPDAPKTGADASMATVQMVTCPATPAATVMTSGNAYSPPSVTIMQGQVVQFVMPSVHNVVPGHIPADATTSDPGVSVNFNETKCLMFTHAGSYGFHCGPHQFNGTVTVQ